MHPAAWDAGFIHNVTNHVVCAIVCREDWEGHTERWNSRQKR